LTDIWFKRVIRDQNKYFDTNYRHFRHWKILSCHDLGYQMSIYFLKLYTKLKPLISSLLWNLHHENISLHSKVIPINVLKIPVLVFRHWKILSCHDLGYQMSIFLFKTLYQIKAFNIFFIMEFTSWKHLIPFKSYTYKRTGKYLSWF
jgi:hypothetical protein